MGNHGGGVDKPLLHHLEGFDHVVGVAAAGAHNVGSGIVNVIEIKLGLEFRIGRAGKEVQAAVVG